MAFYRFLLLPFTVALFPFQNTSLPAWDRAGDLVSRLNLSEQVNLLLATDARTGAVPRFNVTDYNWWTECNSGVGVEFPQNVNIAATFNRTVAFLAGRGTGIGLRKRADAAVQDLSCWSPMMNTMRHPFWGRGHEGYGEDQYLAGEMGFQNVSHRPAKRKRPARSTPQLINPHYTFNGSLPIMQTGARHPGVWAAGVPAL